MPTATPETSLEALAQFWAGHLVHVAPQPFSEDRADRQLARLYLDRAERQVHPLDEGLRLYQALLTVAAPQLAQRGYVHTYTDYGAMGLLREAADLAGVTLGQASLPCRTSVVARPHETEVRLGVGAPWTVLWHRPAPLAHCAADI